MKYKIYNNNIYITTNIRIIIRLIAYSQCYITDAAMNEKISLLKQQALSMRDGNSKNLI